jgi:hypothetical protein
MRDSTRLGTDEVSLSGRGESGRIEVRDAGGGREKLETYLWN